MMETYYIRIDTLKLNLKKNNLGRNTEEIRIFNQKPLKWRMTEYGREQISYQ